MVQYEGNLSEPFDIKSRVKQCCVLGPILFGIFFSLLLKHTFGTATEGLYLHIISDGRLFSLARLRAKIKVREIIVRDLLFADDAAVTTHTIQELQTLMDRFSQACKDCGLTISLKRLMCWPGVWKHHLSPPSATINKELYTSSRTLGPQSLTTCPLMWKSTSASGKLQQHLVNLPHMSGSTLSCQPRPR